MLLAGVTHALRALLPGFGDELLELLNQPPKELPSNVELAAVFARAYSALAHHSIHLVLDDYHTVAESHALNRLLNSLLSYTPPSLHFVVLSRRNPQFATTKLKLAGEIGSIGLDLLRLERTQAGRAVEQRTGRAWSEEDLEKLLLLTEGWPAGIALAGRSTKAMLATTRQKTRFSPPQGTPLFWISQNKRTEMKRRSFALSS